jgi:hypothetical protein
MLVCMRSIIILFVVLFSFSNVSSQIPQNLTIQGVFVDKNGKPLEGEHFVTSSVFYQENGGNSIYTQRDTIKIHSGGLYLISLGKNQSDFQNISFSKPLYIQLDLDNVSSNVRIPLSTTPYSFMALKVSDSSITEANLDSNLIKKINDSYTPSSGKYIGEMKYWNGRSWESITPGNFSEQLTLCQGDIPRWGPCPSIPIVNILNKLASYQSGYDNQSKYISRSKIRLIFTAYDPSRRDTLDEVGVIYGDSSELDFNDKIVKLTVNKFQLEDEYSIDMDILNDKKLTYVKAYAKNKAGISFSQELGLIGLNSKISDTILPDYKTIDWILPDTNKNKIYFKTSKDPSDTRKSHIYTYDEVNNKLTQSYDYDLPVANPGYESDKNILANEYFIYDGGIQLFNFTDASANILHKRKLNFSLIDTLLLSSETFYDTEFLGENSRYSYINKYNDDLYLIGSSITDYPYLSLHKLGKDDSIKKIEVLDISIPSGNNDWAIVDSNIVMYYNRQIGGEYPILRSYTLDGKLVKSLDYYYEIGMRKPLVPCINSSSFFIVDWVSGELKRYNKKLEFIQTYNLPSLININLNSDNNCTIIQKSGFIKLFLSDLNNRILSFDLYD